MFLLIYAKLEEFIKWLGLFATDPVKGIPATKNGIMLMGMTTICVLVAWIVFRAPYVPGYMAIVVECLLIIAGSSGLTYLGGKHLDKKKQAAEPKE